MVGVTHIHLALTRWPPSLGACGDNSKESYCILDTTANMRACCLGNHLVTSPVVLSVTFVKKKSISEKCEEDVACVRHAGLRKCLSLPCCGACMPGSLPSVVLTHGSFDIAYSYWYVKGRCVKSECCQLCVGCGRCCGASWCGIRWQICDTVWVNRTQESKEWE